MWCWAVEHVQYHETINLNLVTQQESHWNNHEQKHNNHNHYNNHDNNNHHNHNHHNHNQQPLSPMWQLQWYKKCIKESYILNLELPTPRGRKLSNFAISAFSRSLGMVVAPFLRRNHVFCHQSWVTPWFIKSFIFRKSIQRILKFITWCNLKRPKKTWNKLNFQKWIYCWTDCCHWICLHCFSPKRTVIMFLRIWE